MQETLHCLTQHSESQQAYYKKTIEEFSEEQKANLEDLVIRLKNAGAKKPLPWAMSETREGIPQFGRFLMLKNIFQKAASIKDTIAISDDLDEDLEDKYQELIDLAGEEKLLDFLRAYSKGLAYNFVELLDEGNRNARKDKISWVLMQTDGDGEPSGQIIQALHENFLDFEEELE